MRGPRHVFLSCGEASGDRYGAALVAALRAARARPALHRARRPRAARRPASRSSSRRRDVAVMGFGEVARRAAGAAARRAGASTGTWPRRRRPLPADRFSRLQRPPGRPARAAAACPSSSWWRRSSGPGAAGARRRSAGAVDRLGTILPFETEFFRARGLRRGAAGPSADGGLRRPLPLRPGLARREERLEPPRRAADHRPAARQPAPGGGPACCRSLKVTARPITAHLARPRRALRGQPGARRRPRLRAATLFSGRGRVQRPNRCRELLPRLDLALVCSGTASLEVALAGVPHEIVYRTGSADRLPGAPPA